MPWELAAARRELRVNRVDLGRVDLGRVASAALPGDVLVEGPWWDLPPMVPGGARHRA